MLKYLVFICVYLLVRSLQAQVPTDFICMDPSRKIEYVDYRGVAETYQYIRSFKYNDTNHVHVYLRSWITDEKKKHKDSIIVITTPKTLILTGYVYDGDVYRDDPYADTIPMVNPGDTIIKNTSIYADMSYTEYVVTITYLEEYTLSNGLKFKDVIKYDQFSYQTEMHYITYVAKGQGIINRGEHELIRQPPQNK